MNVPPEHRDSDSPHAHLGLWDAVSIIVGIVVGTTIFKAPQLIFSNVQGPWQGIGCWVLGGVLALIGSLCYAELATTYPRMGGDYVYLTRAFGRCLGFLFGWAQLAVILTGSIGIMAYAFADYAAAMLQLDKVTYTYRVTVVGASPLRITDLTDDAGTPKSASDDVKPELVGGDANRNGLVDSGETWSYAAEAPLGQAQMESGQAIVEGASVEARRSGPATTSDTMVQSRLRVQKTSDRDFVEGRVACIAAAPVVVLTILNLLGVVFGKAVQNLLSCVKVLGLLAIVGAGLGWGGQASAAPAQPMTGAGFGLAMVFVLYAYGGWNDAAFVAAEVRNRGRNMPLALVFGTAGITVIYVLVNCAYLWGLGFEGVRASSAPAADVAKLAMGHIAGSAAGLWGSKLISLLVMVSALGAINGLVFTGSRIYVSMGADHRVFAWLGRWNARRGVSVRSLLAQTAVALLLIFAVGTTAGQNAVDAALISIGRKALPWAEYYGGFNTLVAATSPVFWGFFLLTGYSLFILRAKDHDVVRPFSTPLYPLEPILFCGTCHFMLFSAIEYAKDLSLLGLVPLAIGLPLYFVSQWRSASGAATN